MWIFLAFASAFFAGITAVLAKCGIRKTDSDIATALRTVVVLLFSWLMVLVVGSAPTIASISTKSWLFLILSGLATGASWLCYFRALSIGDVNKVVPIDKSSVILTLLFAFLLLGEPIGVSKAFAMILIGAGTFLMIEKKQTDKTVPGHGYIVYAALSAVFAALTSILVKIGLAGVESNLGTAVRTCVVLAMAWVIVFLKGKQKELLSVPHRELLFICLSGISTGASWLCCFRALRDGLASVVVPIDKLSILISIGFSFFVFGEKLSQKAAWGLLLIVAGTLLMLA